MRIEEQEIKEEYQIPMQLPGRLTSLEIINGAPRLAITTRRTNRNFILQGDNLVPYAPPGSTPEMLHKIMLEHPDFTIFATLDSLLIVDQGGARLTGYGMAGLHGLESARYITRSFLDHQNNLWIASFKGIIKINIRQNLFQVHYPKSNVSGLAVLDGELTITEPSSDSIINKHPNFSGIARNPFSFYIDDAKRAWMGTVLPFIAVYDPANSSTTHIHLEQGHWSEYVYQNSTTGNYWVATNQGLYILEAQGPALENYRMGRSILPDLGKSILIRDFYRNQEGIWVATEQGLFLIDAVKEEWVEHFSRTNGFPAQHLMAMHEDENGIFWLASMDGGLLRWDRENNDVQQFSVDFGFPGNSVSTVFEDEYQTLWLASSQGLIAFDKATHSTKVYHTSDGISNNSFNALAHEQAEDGTIYLGSPGGITSFHPRDLQKKSQSAMPLYLSRLEVLEKGQEKFTDRTAAFKKDNQIVLQPNGRILRVEAVLLDYEKSLENKYAYKLSGKDGNWIQIKENQFTLLNLPYGQYVLKVKASGSSGIWTENMLELPIKVLKPIYLRTWFLLCAVILFLLLMISFVQYRVRSLKKVQKKLEREVDKQTRQLRSDKQVIEAQAEELRKLDKIKTRFFSNITHEFRTPLTLIIGPVEQLLKDNLPKPALRRLSGVAKNARQILILINQLLDLSKLESGQMKVEASHGDIIAYTRELTARFYPLAEQKGQRLAFISKWDHWETHFDQRKWDKIIYNLTANAIKFTPAGGAIQLSLSKLTKQDKEWIRLIVKDTGQGIEKAHLGDIFSRFYQTDASSTRKQGGTGIGLSLVKELVELQDGEINVISKPEKGASFEIKLPVLQLESDTVFFTPLAKPEIDVPVIPQIPSLINETTHASLEREEKLELLIVEDNEEMREYIRYCIDETKYNITEAVDGEAGIKKAQALIPDLIISDVMMPNKNGYALTKAIRKNIATSHIPLILLTAKSSLESRLQGLQHGADVYLTKPFNPQELVLRIEKLIEIRHLLQARYQRGLPLIKNDTFRQEDEFIINLKTYILKHIDESDLSGDHIGKHFAMSRVHLYRKLKALTNQSITEFVKSVRLEKAVALIREGKLNLSEIAYQTGFSSIQYFSRSFKKVYGKAPSDFMKMS